MAGEKILVLDDSQNIRDVFAFAFSEYHIILAKNGQEVLNILNKPNDIDLIVLDVMMPDINGLALLKKIKEINTYCKIVMMTGYSSKDIAIQALRLNADEYIEKPFDLEAVREVFRRLLQENGSVRNTGCGHGNEKVKFAQRLIKRNYNKAFSLRDISKELFLNYKYCSRIFKEKTGESFNKYKLGLKIASAKQFLVKYNYTIGQIAYKIGYQNPDSFMKMFKRVTGLTPTEYRQRNKQKNKRKRWRFG
jgi:YesN/AraC family two-component response regulator